MEFKMHNAIKAQVSCLYYETKHGILERGLQISCIRLFLAVQDSSLGDLVTHSAIERLLIFDNYNDCNDYNAFNETTITTMTTMTTETADLDLD